jgi:hypothetical protein
MQDVPYTLYVLFVYMLFYAFTYNAFRYIIWTSSCILFALRLSDPWYTFVRLFYKASIAIFLLPYYGIYGDLGFYT